jgi:hypothetical protein
VTQAFQFLDTSGAGFIELPRLLENYHAEKHPRALSREKTEEEVRKDFENAITAKAYCCLFD